MVMDTLVPPAEKKGSWRSLKADCTALWVEVGCGKGKFTVETAQANPDVLLIAVERCREAMVVAMEKARDMGLTNVFYIDMDVEKIEEIFAAQGMPGAQEPVALREKVQQKFALFRARVAHRELCAARVERGTRSVGNKVEVGVEGAEELAGKAGVVKGQRFREG